MRVLIVGGTGLISTVASRELLARGHSVTLFNRSKTATRFAGDVERINGDRTDHPAFEMHMRGLGAFDCVLDMVCFVPADADSVVRAFAGRTAHYVLCSSVDAYAKSHVGYPVNEDRPLEPVSAYGRDKAHCERILTAAHARGDLNVTIIRPATVYGEGSAPSHTFGRKTTFLDRIRKGRPVVVHGDGSSVWCWCHCDDAGRAFAAAAGNPRTFGRAYHLAGAERMTWAHYYGLVAQALDAPVPVIVRIPTDVLARMAPGRAQVTRENYQFNNIFDTSAARDDLDFRHTVPVLEGVRRNYAWLVENGRIENCDDDPFDDRIIAAWQNATGLLKDI